MNPDHVRAIEISVADVTPKTSWIFVELETAAGLRGVGEASLNGREDEVLAAAKKLAPVILDRDPSPDGLPNDYPLTVLPDAAAFSAIDQALWDLTAQRGNFRLADALGGVRRDVIPLYANINRRTLDRSPNGFAASALDAIAAGHEAIKIAPFDEVTPQLRKSGNIMASLAPGLARIEAVRSAIGRERRLMIDCHWRLDEAAAQAVIVQAAASEPYWIECPLPESLENLPALRRLRRFANRHGIRLAGCEENVRHLGFAPFLQAEVYDVMMPDVKYAGGLLEMLGLSTTMADSGVEFSPHNPSGPISHAASLHVAAAAGNFTMLECQFDETPWFDRLRGSSLPAPVQGNAALPSAPGLGAVLDRHALDQCRRARWRVP